MQKCFCFLWPSTFFWCKYFGNQVFYVSHGNREIRLNSWKSSIFAPVNCDENNTVALGVSKTTWNIHGVL